MTRCLDGGDAGGDRGVPVDRPQAGVAGVAAEPFVGVVLDGGPWRSSMKYRQSPAPNEMVARGKCGLASRSNSQPMWSACRWVQTTSVTSSRSTPGPGARREAGRRTGGRRRPRRRRPPRWAPSPRRPERTGHRCGEGSSRSGARPGRGGRTGRRVRRRWRGRRSSRGGRRTSRRRWRSAGCCQRPQATSQSRPEGSATHSSNGRVRSSTGAQSEPGAQIGTGLRPVGLRESSEREPPAERRSGSGKHPDPAPGRPRCQVSARSPNSSGRTQAPGESMGPDPLQDDPSARWVHGSRPSLRHGPNLDLQDGPLPRAASGPEPTPERRGHNPARPLS